MITFDDRWTDGFIRPHEREAMRDAVAHARTRLDAGTCPGAEYTGWVNLPETTPSALIDDVNAVASQIREHFDVLVVVGIGGSYLGARAVIEALSHHFDALRDREERGPLILFAGHQLSSDYMHDLLEVLRGRRVALNVISKSGTTTEPAIAFRVLRDALFADATDDELRDAIVVTTDAEHGALRALASELGLKTFIIPADIGGRYSVLTPVGLLPIAVAGIDIRRLIEGAARERTRSVAPMDDNTWVPCDRYAVDRMLLARKGYRAELLAAYEPSMHYFAEWWKQLFGESEGKDGKGLLPMSAAFTTDLHSLGQLIQDGPSILFETVLNIRDTAHTVVIPEDRRDLDRLSYLAGRTLADVNRSARLGTALAHVDGGVPNMVFDVPDRSPESMGSLIYAFERACALSGILNDVNPFNQPGVEAYKRNMFALLGKPGFESLRDELLGGTQ